MMIPIALIAFFQAGFFLVWFRARIGRGKYILVKLRGKVRDTFTLGEEKDGFIIYGKKDERKRSSLPDAEVFYNAWGVLCVDINPANGDVYTRDQRAASGYDPEKAESLYTRALYKPVLGDGDIKRLMIIFFVVTMAGLGVLGFFLFMILKAVNSGAAAGVV